MQQSKEGPDRGWSWVVTFAGFSVALILAGIYRTSGILLVAFISEFNCTREEASWPLVLFIAVCNLIGIVAGPLGQQFGIRPISILGSLVATVGMSSCYLASSLTFITIAFGIVFGIGYGLTFTLMPVIVNNYFFNHKATATGIAYSGSCFGSVILPPLYEYMINNYGLKGCFLLTGGIVLQTAISGVLMRPPSWLKTPQDKSAIRSTENKHSIDNQQSGTSNILCQTKDSDNQTYPNHEQFVPSAITQEVIGKTAKKPNEGLYEQEYQIPCVDVNMSNQHTAVESSNNLLFSRKRLNTIHANDNHNILIPDPKFAIKHSVTHDFRNEKEISFLNLNVSELKNETDVRKYTEIETSDPSLGICTTFRHVLTTPMFLVTSFNSIGFFFLYHMYVVIIVDFALDSDIPEEETKYILFSFALSDLIGRLCFGWITDRNILKRSQFVMITMLATSVVFFIYPFAHGLNLHIGFSCMYGLLMGCAIVIFPILIVDYVGLEMLSVGHGCLCFFNGVATLIWPWIIGYFRDTMGSYSNMFYVLGAISLCTSLLFLLEKRFIKKYTM